MDHFILHLLRIVCTVIISLCKVMWYWSFLPLALTHWFLKDMDAILKMAFHSCSNGWYPQIFLWLCPQMNVRCYGKLDAVSRQNPRSHIILDCTSLICDSYIMQKTEATKATKWRMNYIDGWQLLTNIRLINKAAMYLICHMKNNYRPILYYR